MDIRQNKGYFFDLDGTLVDSSPNHAASFQKVLSQYFPDIGEKFDYEKYKGKATPAVFQELGIEDDQMVAYLTKEKRRLYLEEIHQRRVPVMPGAKEILELLYSMGRKIFIVTSAGLEGATAILEVYGLKQWIKGIITSQEVKNNKPYPDIYLLALQRSDLKPGEVVVIEDSLAGQTAAQKAGLSCILVNQNNIKDAEKEFKSLQELYLVVKTQLSHLS